LPIRETVARNTAYNAAGRVWDAVVSLVLIAYIVSRIGVEQYGLWAIVAAITGYAALFDLGVASAYSKYIAEHAARNERERISAVVSTGFFYQIAFSAVFLTGAWFAIDSLVELLRDWRNAGALGTEAVTADLAFLLKWTLALLAASNCLAPFVAVQSGLQRMGVTNLVSAGASLVKVAATVWFLESGMGIRGLVYANAAVLGVFAVAAVAATFAICPSLRVAPWRASWPMFLRLFAFGWRTQVSRLANLVTFETDVLIITFVLRDLQLAGLYRIGVELANKMRQGPVVLMSAMIPAAAHLEAVHDGERLRALYLRATKYVAAITVPLAAFTAGGAGLLMTAWQGPALGLGVSVVVLRILCAGYVANILPGPGVAVALGMGRPGVQMIAGLISMVSNLALTIAFVFAFGFWGVPVATALSMAISWAWFTAAMQRLVGVGPRELFATAMRGPLFAGIAPLTFIAACDALSAGIDSRAAALAVVAVAFIVFSGLYLTLLRRSGTFDAADFDFFERVLKLNRVPGYTLWARPLRQG
jgi:O-antigen/teichoic acid export membrane protein